ncbi:MAG TPA: leucyl/phenylalanyl-tRNA--protein transferase [Candidatus Nanopelagicales bacterium]
MSPVEPRGSRYVLPDLRGLPPGEELVAVGGELTPAMLLAGYRAGLFPMPEGRLLGWWSPDPRGVLVPGQVHVGRSLRRALGRFTVSIDRRFEEVVAACADPGRPHGWISPGYRVAYAGLHELGWAHSVEVWDEAGGLAGGLFGVEVGGLFAAESKFHLATDASKVAVVALADVLAAAPAPRLIDVQWRTPHLTSLGVVELPRTTYLDLVARLVTQPPVLAGGVPGAQRGAPSRIRWRSA